MLGTCGVRPADRKCLTRNIKKKPISWVQGPLNVSAAFYSSPAKLKPCNSWIVCPLPVRLRKENKCLFFLKRKPFWKMRAPHAMCWSECLSWNSVLRYKYLILLPWSEGGGCFEKSQLSYFMMVTFISPHACLIIHHPTITISSEF